MAPTCVRLVEHSQVVLKEGQQNRECKGEGQGECVNDDREQTED